MTPTRLAEILRDLQPLGLSARGLAKLWGYKSETSIRQMLSGRTTVPDDDRAAWLEGLWGWWVSRPPPPRQL